jgi:hypothetical protein
VRFFRQFRLGVLEKFPALGREPSVPGARGRAHVLGEGVPAARGNISSARQAAKAAHGAPLLRQCAIKWRIMKSRQPVWSAQVGARQAADVASAACGGKRSRRMVALGRQIGGSGVSAETAAVSTAAHVGRAAEPNRKWLGPEYLGTLQKHGVAHVYNNWTDMPSVGEQLGVVGEQRVDTFSVARFLL